MRGRTWGGTYASLEAYCGSMGLGWAAAMFFLGPYGGQLPVGGGGTVGVECYGAFLVANCRSVSEYSVGLE